VIGQVAEFIAGFWLRGELDLHETIMTGAADKVLVFKERPRKN